MYSTTASTAASRSSNKGGPQKLYSKIINKINSIPNEVKLGLHKTSKSTSKVQNVKITANSKKKTIAIVKKDENGNKLNHEYENVLVANSKMQIYSKDDKLKNAFCLSLEDEIFEELEKVAHDEAKLNATLQNFDKIIAEFNNRNVDEKIDPFASLKPPVPQKTLPDLTKRLQKSKTCSIIESRCILKKSSGQSTSSTSLNTTTLTDACLARSLLNLKDLEDFSKSCTAKETTKNIVHSKPPIKASPKSQLPRARSYFDLRNSPMNLSNPNMRSNLGSKIPISTSGSRSNSFILPPGTNTNAILSATAQKLKIVHQKTHPKLKMSNSTNSILNATPAVITPLKIVEAPIRRKSRDNGDLLLDKCLEKGQKILKKVEEMNVKPKVTSIKSTSDCVTAENNLNTIEVHSIKAIANNSNIDVVDSASLSVQKQQNTKNSQNKQNTLVIVTKTINNAPKSTPTVAIVEPVIKSLVMDCSVEADIPKNKVKQIIKKCNSIESPMQISKTSNNKVTVVKSIKTNDEKNVHISVISITPPQISSPPNSLKMLPNDRDDKYQSDCSDDSGHISNENEDMKTPPIPVVPGKLTESLIEKFEQNCRKNATKININNNNNNNNDDNNVNSNSNNSNCSKIVINKKVMRNEILIANPAMPTSLNLIELNDSKKQLKTASIEIVPDVNSRCKSEVLFRSGVLNQLEAKRDELLSDRTIQLQAYCRGYLARRRLAQRRVQELAVRCIQRNVRAFIKVREWPWWRLLVRVTPLLNVHRTEEQLKIATGELQTLKAKLEKVEGERAALKTENSKLESRLSEMTAEFAEEQSSSNVIGERLEAETTERLRLEKEIKEYETKYKNLQESSEKLEMELLCAKSDLNGDLDDDDHDNDDNRDNVYRQKYERVARELEFTKKRLQTQHEHDLEQLIGLKKQLEKKLADAYEEVEEQRQVVGQWKRKAQKMTNEMNDLRMLLDEQNSRNNLLEKKQRKFDSECQTLQDAHRQEKLAKERLQREKDVFNAEKFTLEQTLSDVRLELELKEEKYSALQRELDEMTFGGGTEEEIANLKRTKMDLDRKCKEQEEELDEMAGQIQLLEQAKLRLEMTLETMRKDARKEAQQRDDELEEIRGSSYKKIKTLECQLEQEHEERTLLLREKHELERRLNNLEENDRHEKAVEEAMVQKMKRDLRKYKALLRDAQSQLERAKSDGAGKAMIRQLRNQLEDVEGARAIAVKSKQTAESELQDVQLQLEEAQRARYEAEEKATAAQRDRTELQAQIDENEEEMAELLKKYSLTVKQMNTQQSSISEYEIRISELETEKKSMKDQISELTARLENVESMGDSSTSIQNKRLELRAKELESRLEFEHTTRARMEVQLNRHKDALDKAQTEISQARAKEIQAQESLKKSQKSLRELREEFHSISNKEQEAMSRRKDLEKQLETVEAEAASARADLRLALQRISDLQQAMEEGDSYHSDSDNSESSIDSLSELNFRANSSLSHVSDYARKLRTSTDSNGDNTTLCIREEKDNTPRITLTTAATATKSKTKVVSRMTNGGDGGVGSGSSSYA